MILASAASVLGTFWFIGLTTVVSAIAGAIFLPPLVRKLKLFEK